MDEPPVKLAIRHGHDEFEWRHENEWPIARTQWTKLYLDLSKPDDSRRQRHRRHARTQQPFADRVAHL